MAYVAPTTRSTGFLVTAAVWNQDVVDNVAFLYSPPRAQVRRNSTQSITNGAWNLVTWNVEDVDTDGLFATGTGDRFTAATAGRYLVAFSIGFTTNTTNARGWAIAKGTSAGANFVASKIQNPVATFGSPEAITAEVVLAVGETVSCQVFQNSGASLNTDADASNTPARATVRWVAPT